MSSLRVLVVEDEPLARDYAVAVMTRAGILVDTAASVAGGSDDAFDAILLDLQLDDTKGLATLEAARRKWPDSAVVVYTGLDDPMIMKCDADGLIVKGDSVADSMVRTMRLSIQRKAERAQVLETVQRLRTDVQSLDAVTARMQATLTVMNAGLLIDG